MSENVEQSRRGRHRRRRGLAGWLENRRRDQERDVAESLAWIEKVRTAGQSATLS